MGPESKEGFNPGLDLKIYTNPEVDPSQQSQGERLAVAYLELVNSRGLDCVSEIVVGFGPAEDVDQNIWYILTLTTKDLLLESLADFFQLVGVETDLYNNPDFNDLPMYFSIESPARVDLSPLDIFQKFFPSSKVYVEATPVR